MSDEAAGSASADYTRAEVRSRIRVYILIAILGSLLASIVDLASMPDAQLAAMSPRRWAIKLSLLLLGALLAGANAFRAAIDRSTSAPGTKPDAPSEPDGASTTSAFKSAVPSLACVLALAIGISACATTSNPKAAKPNTGAFPDLTDGKPMVVNACVHDANVAYAKLTQYQGANPRLIVIYYTVVGTPHPIVYRFGHEMTEFTWSKRVYLFDRSNGGQHIVPLPPGIDPGNAAAVARFAIPSCYLSFWTQPNPTQISLP